MGDVQYRFSPHVTIGANYTFYHFGYTHGLGGAYIHAAAFTTAYRMSPWTELSFFVGPSRMESSFEQAVPIDPSFLAILCPPADRVACPFRDGVVISHNVWSAPVSEQGSQGPSSTARFTSTRPNPSHPGTVCSSRPGQPRLRSDTGIRFFGTGV
jgi:hypothetical protein